MKSQIHIITIGKLGSKLEPIANIYKSRLRWSLKISELSHSKKLPSTQLKNFESDLILKAMDPKSYKVALDVTGGMMSSHQFAKLINSSIEQSQMIEFIIGGAFGFGEEVLKNVNTRLSLSAMTMPHEIAEVILLEQIYRAWTIINNHPYHK